LDSRDRRQREARPSSAQAPPKMRRIGIVSDLSRRLPLWVVFDRRLLELGCAAEYVDIRAGQQAIRQSARLIVASSLLPAPTR
jgi:hypothetical protein